LFLYRSNQPESVSLEVTTYCNFSCRMCYKQAYNIGNQHMAAEVFERINTQLPGDTKKISLSGLGEGLMNKELVKFISLLREKHPRTFIDFTTNGCLLNDKIMKGLLSSSVNMVTFSLDTIDVPIPEDGHKASPKVVENIEKFAGLIKENGSNISLRLQSIVFSKKQLEELMAFAKKHGFSIVNLIRMDTPSNPEQKRLSIDEFRRLFRMARALGRKDKIPVVSSGYHNLFMKIASHFDKICLQYHNFLYFDVNGNVLPCCVLRKYSFGNIMEQPLKEIWESKMAAEFYRKQDKLCTNCDVWRHNYSH